MKLLIIMALTACFHTPAKSVSEASDALNSFAFRFYSELEAGESGTDRFVSPLSASLALSLLNTGAQGATEKEIVKALGFDCETGGMNERIQELVAGILSADEGTTLEIANSLWASGDISLKEKYLADASKYFDAEVRNLDFKAPGAAGEINAWVDAKTHGCIRNIIDKADPGMLLALLNAVYFKGEWADEFTSGKDDRFRTIDLQESPVRMMQRSGRYAYCEDEKFKMIEIPYGNGSFVMDVILPCDEDPSHFSEEITALDLDEWNSLTGALKSQTVRLYLPKFKMEYEIDLEGCLNSLGIRRAFTSKADFSGISTTPLMVSKVKQKAFVDVTETGTEAAAVTFIGMKATSAGPSERPVIFRADRPFVFAIREKESGVIIFLGQKVK